MHIHREKRGSGTPIILSCGIGDASPIWQPYIEPLSKENTLVTWDHRGHGQSDKTEDPDLYTRDLAIADLKENIEFAGGSEDNPAILIGHSLGGYLSLCLTLQNPELVKALVLIASGPGFKDQAARDKWNTTAVSIDLGEEVAREARRLGVQPDSMVMENITKIDKPTLVIVGSEDRRFVGAKDYLVKKIEGAEGLEIAGAKHSVHQSHPTEVQAAILNFLNKA